MATATYELIASNVLSATASSVSFTSISGSYRDLVLVTDISSSGTSPVAITFNSDTGNNYTFIDITGDGTTDTSAVSTGRANILGEEASSTERTLNILEIMDYSQTNKRKHILCRFGRIGARVEVAGYIWGNTAAITSITITSSGTAYAIGSSFYLYGIAG